MTWPVVPLGEVAETALGKMLDRGRPRGHDHVPYLRNVNVQWGRIDTDDLLTMELPSHERERFGVRAGDLLVCEGGEIGRSAIWGGRVDYIAYQKALHRIRPGPQLDSLFLRYLLEYQSVTGTLAGLSTGTTIAHLPQQQLRRVPVPLPPLLEQRRIVDLLEDHLSRLDAAEQYTNAALVRVIRLHKAYWMSVFQALNDPVCPLTNAATIANGQTPKGVSELLTSTRKPEDVPFYKIGDMNAAEGRWMAAARLFVSQPAARKLGLHIRPAGTVLIPKRGGAIATNKKRILRSPACFDLNTMGLVPSATLDPSYLFHWLQGIDLTQLADGSNVPQINARQIESLELPLPSLMHQRRIVGQLDDLVTSADRIAETARRAIVRNRHLRRSLFSAAFSGRLNSRSDLPEVEETITT